MKTIVSTGGGPGGLAVEERPQPRPGPRQLLVRMSAASLNYRDLEVVARARDAARPLVPVSDGVGRVVAAGPEVTRFRTGDRVSPIFFPDWIAGEPSAEARRRRLGGPDDGVLAEYVAVDEHAAVAPPAHLSDVEAAALPCAGVTAWSALFVTDRVLPGETVVVQGTGGVSTFAILLAAQAGARVIVVSGSAAKLERARALGAGDGIDRRAEPEWHERVLELTGGRGADHVIDVAGGDGLTRSLAATRVGGTISLAGYVAGHTGRFDLATAFVRRLRMQGLGVGSRDSFEALVRALESSEARPPIDRVFPVDELAAALTHLETGGPFGKVALTFAVG